jgi:hypothetical protein
MRGCVSAQGDSGRQRDNQGDRYDDNHTHGSSEASHARRHPVDANVGLAATEVLTGVSAAGAARQPPVAWGWERAAASCTWIGGAIGSDTPR